MKKLIALFMATFMVLSLCAVCAVAEGETLVSSGKTYTISGNGHGYINLEGQWPSQYDAELTDGVAHEELTFALTRNWFAFYYNKDAQYSDFINAPDGIGYVIIDLGEVTDNLTKFRAHLGNHHGNGVPTPDYVKVYTSVDGTAFTEVGQFDGLIDNKTEEGAVVSYWVELASAGVSARYVKFEFDLGGVFAFVNELEVYASSGSSEPVKPAEPTVTTIDLLTQFGEPTITSGGDGNITYTLENGVLTVVGDQGWPSIDLPFTEAIGVDVANTRLILEATIENGSGSVRFLGADDNATNDDIYLHQFAEGVTLDGSGDATAPATINLDIAFSDLAFCDYSAGTGYAGKIAFTEDTVNISKFQVWACGGATVKVTKLQLVVTTMGEGGDKPSIPATGDNGMVALVVLAAASLFGSAVVIRSKH